MDGHGRWRNGGVWPIADLLLRSVHSAKLLQLVGRKTLGHFARHAARGGRSYTGVDKPQLTAASFEHALSRTMAISETARIVISWLIGWGYGKAVPIQPGVPSILLQPRSGSLGAGMRDGVSGCAS
jgi:hypothetical protein